jgi:hypothetical protein
VGGGRKPVVVELRLRPDGGLGDDPGGEGADREEVETSLEAAGRVLIQPTMNGPT